MVKYIDIRDRAIVLFEQSKYRQLDGLIFNELTVDTVDEAVELLAMKALVFQKLYKKFWPAELGADVQKIYSQFVANTSTPKMDSAMAKIWLNEAQIIIRDRRRKDRFTVAILLLRSAEKVFRDQKLEAEMLFVQDEILRTQLEEFLFEDEGGFVVSEFVKNYETLIFKMEACLESGSGDQETLKTWLLNAKFHFLRSLAYFGDKKARTLSMEVANEFSARGNKVKSIAAKIYGLGEIGFYLNQLLAKIKGE